MSLSGTMRAIATTIRLPPSFQNTCGVRFPMWQDRSRPVIRSDLFNVLDSVGADIGLCTFLAFSHPAIVHMLMPIKFSQRLRRMTFEACRHRTILT